MRFRSHYRKLKHVVLSPANIPAALAVLVVAIFGAFADHQNRVLFQQQLRSEVLSEMSVVRAKLEGNINGTIQLVRGLVAVIASEPDMDQARFAQLSAKLFEKESQLRSIAAAPGLVIRMVYPVAGNEKVVGLDYRAHELQREAALRARDTGDLVLAGPVDLVQGGRGYVGRFPVFIGGSSDSAFWGLVSAVIDVDRLYGDSGLLDPKLKIDIAIKGRDALGEAGSQFYGRPEVFANDPVLADVVLPSGSWQIAAVPRRGWDAVPPNAWLLRAVMVAAALVIAIPLAAAGRLQADRQRSFEKLARRERQLQVLSRRLELALEVSGIGVWEADLGVGQTTWDHRTFELYGRRTEAGPLPEEQWEEAVHPQDREKAIRAYADAVEARRGYESEFRILRPDGAVRHLRTRAAFYTDPDGTRKMIGAEWDVTDDIELNRDLRRAKLLAEERSTALELANARIEHNALHDSLTGLPNRRYLDRRLGEIGAAGGTGTGLLHIDLDRFKQINDTLGHAAGDAMLVHAAEVLKSTACEGDFVARIGGDEFVVVCARDAGEGRLAALAERIITRMRQPVSYDGHECRFGVSVGIAREEEGGFDAKQLLVNADIALYRAKSRGRNRYEFFTAALQAEIVTTKRTADEVLTALDRDEFLPFFQPQFDARTLEIAGVEALARWKHPSRGLLAPDRFLKIAEELNVVGTIDRLILEKTLGHFARWEGEGLGIPKVSVNVSARRLQEDELVKSLRELGIPRGTVSFELVESIFLDENDEVVEWNVEQIKELGIDVEIDDFGTGYASIVSLIRLKPRRLKIDRQLVMPIVEAPAQRHLVASMIEIGRSLDIEVIAEGVETMEHARILRDLGCDMLQGFAFAAPMGAEAFAEFVRARRWRRAS